MGVVGGMESENLATEFCTVDVQVDLGGGYRGVAKHHLYGIEWRTSFEEMCSE